MKYILSALLSLAVVFGGVATVFADQYVNGYYRSNGTYVNGYYRSSPDSSPYNNFSYPGNTNPYTGVTAGGNASTYLNNYYGGGSSYTSSYNYNSDCPSYGFAYLGDCYELPDHAKQSGLTGFSCDYGYDEVGYGLSKRCLPEVDHGYRIGTSIFCDYGYELHYSSCLKKSSGSYSYTSGYSTSDYDFGSLNSCPSHSSESLADSDKCICDVGYEPNKKKDGCKKITKKTNDKICRASFGKYSLWSGKYDEEDGVATCKCKKGYEWSEGGAGNTCIKES